MPKRYPPEFRRKVLDISDQTIYALRRKELIDTGARRAHPRTRDHRRACPVAFGQVHFLATSRVEVAPTRRALRDRPSATAGGSRSARPDDHALRSGPNVNAGAPSSDHGRVSAHRHRKGEGLPAATSASTSTAGRSAARRTRSAKARHPPDILAEVGPAIGQPVHHHPLTRLRVFIPNPAWSIHDLWTTLDQAIED
jgi:hypothetical protein